MKRNVSFSKKQKIAAVLLTAFGLLSGILAKGYPLRELSPEAQEPALPQSASTAPALSESIPAPSVQRSRSSRLEAAEAGSPAIFFPAADKLNLAFFYEDEEDAGNPMNSYAGKLYTLLMKKEAEFLASLYEQGETLSGVPEDCLRNIRFRFCDADGRERRDSSNIKEIMSLVNVYCYKHNYRDAVLYRELCLELFERSHSHRVSVGTVRYDTDSSQESVSSEEASEVSEASSEDTGTSEGAETFEASEASEISEISEADAKKCVTATGSELPKSAEEESLEKKQYRGSVEILFQICIADLDDEKGLLSLSLKADDALTEFDSLHPKASRWKGWNEENLSSVTALLAQDWFESYGISYVTLRPGAPLQKEEISAYLDRLPKALSAERKQLLRYALHSVGRIPYYYGGKAAYAGYEKNNFGRVTAPDSKGRRQKGLDCSGWIQWVYWSSLGMDLNGSAGTGTLIDEGQPVQLSELQPGDILLSTGEDSHAVLFLEWTKAGKLLAVHENAEDGSVAVGELEADFPYRRALLSS